MRRRSPHVLVLALAALLALVTVAAGVPAAGATTQPAQSATAAKAKKAKKAKRKKAHKHKTRVIHWSGYRWTVRHETKRANPGNNRWGDGKDSVSLTSTGRLRLDISKGRAVELVGPRTSYGRYTWVVETDLSQADPFRVAAFFVRGTGAEQDIEFSRWGEPFSGAAASWVSWKNPKDRLGWGGFAVTPLMPFTIAIEWRPTSTRYAVTDNAGAVLLDTTFPSAPGRSNISPRVSYWLYPGHGTLTNPYTDATVHPPLLVRSFSFSRT